VRDTSTFGVFTNLAPHARVNFNVTYQQVLRRTLGVYKHVINVQPYYVCCAHFAHTICPLVQNVKTLSIDILLAERERISKIYVPNFSKDNALMTNKQLLALPSG
jgi:hypothetical protein